MYTSDDFEVLSVSNMNKKYELLSTSQHTEARPQLPGSQGPLKAHALRVPKARVTPDPRVARNILFLKELFLCFF